MPFMNQRELGFAHRPKNPFMSICRRFDCDVAVPNVTGIGDILMYTRMVEEVSMRFGRPINLLTGPIQPLMMLES